MNISVSTKLVEKKENIDVILSHTVERVIGEEAFEGIVIKGADQEKTLNFDGMFVAIGLVPKMKPFENILDLDSRGYALSDEKCLTATEGIFVAGDCRTKEIRQISTACADGAVAGLAAVKFVESL